MYESFYKLKEKPFSLLPDPSFLYLSEKHQMALTLLEYSLMNQAGFCVISGVAGAGKTTLIRHLLNQFGNNVAVGLITNTHQSFSDLLRWILMSFNLDYSSDSKPQLYQTFVNFLIDQYAKNRNTVLIVDEAQNMSIEALEELRMLSNINADKDQVLQIILVGQPGLRDKLSRPDLEQFAQRIAVDYHIEPLNAEETGSYIAHRLAHAGGDPELFEHDAAQSIYRHSNGIPRLINLLCESAMVYGYAEGVPRISARLVEDVARERQMNGLLPHMQPEPAAITSSHANLPRDIGIAKKVSSPPAAELAPAASPLPLEDEALAETAQIAERAISAMGGHSGTGMGEMRHALEAQQQGHRAEAVDEAVQAGMAQGDTVRERRTGVVSRLVHLDTRTRNTTDAGHVHHPIARSEAEPPAPIVVTDAPQQPEAIETAKGKDDGAEFPREASTLAPDIAQDVTGKAADDNEVAKPIAAVHEDRDMANNNISRNGTTGMGSGSKWIVATALGFSGGLLVAVTLFVTTYYKTAADVPAAAQAASLPSVASTATAMPAKNSATVDQAMLDALQRERDAAIAQTRALERERDAVLATSKARERTNTSTSAISASRAREEEKTATLAAIKAQERAAAELEALVVQERERAAALAAAMAQLSKPPVESKPVPRAEAAIVVPEAKVAEAAARTETRPADKLATSETPAKFSANPCKGPSAKFLSTCKE